MEKAYIRIYNNMHMIHKTLPTYKYDYTDNFETQFRTLPEVIAYETCFVDPQYGLEPYWDENLYIQDKLKYKDTYNKPNDQNESDDLITDVHVSDALRYALIDLWTVNPHLPDTSALPNFQPRPQNQQKQIAVIDDQILPQLLVTPDGLTRFLQLSTNLPLKNALFSNGFRGVNYWRAHRYGCFVKRHSGSRLSQSSITGSTYKNKWRPPPKFQIMVANGQLDAPIATV